MSNRAESRTRNEPKINEIPPTPPPFTYNSKNHNSPPFNALPPNPQKPPIRIPAPPCYVLAERKTPGQDALG